MKILSWAEFDVAVWILATQARRHGHSGVYGFPRGGLCLAVALSHRLRIPLLSEPQPDCMVVDDVYETGRTLEGARHVEGSMSYAWVSKSPPTWFEAALQARPDEWIVFPWEDRSAVQTDQETYHASRQ